MIDRIDEVKVMCGGSDIGHISGWMEVIHGVGNSEQALRRENNGLSTTVCRYKNTDMQIAGVCVEEAEMSTAVNQLE